ncbi:GNAT family N-acetyltransferase [Tenacibaculum sp. IB213877]|uniref:GNAT family N-acetyltransferase n=1 Tax=Tenacibaculum sp. IB213877 TaxID=3097351 RepID=UPI002A5AC2FC|nr:GNAT family N-acetyltransferase [Tenacibaculum sp. IB213877]MDY0780470.1 GNAT family N-acetyltransferase [Tenacibaculum sp. IB213877]
MKFKVKTFNQLTTSELYDILQLRSEVFVVEQNCVYQDIDGKDQKALHILGIKNNKLIAYTRLFKGGDYFDEASIGRVVVKQSERKYGYGHDLMKFSIETIEEKFNTSTIKIGAQTYLQKFYESHGFKKIGKEYIEDGIPHIHMVKE